MMSVYPGRTSLIGSKMGFMNQVSMELLTILLTILYSRADVARNLLADTVLSKR